MAAPSSFISQPSSSGQSQGGHADDAQLQRMRTDIKNVIPLDIYETMDNASRITADLSKSPAPHIRHISDFYSSFWKLFHFTRKILSDNTRARINTWFIRMENPKAMQDPRLIKQGIALWLEFYDALTEFGMVTLFEGSIQPSFISGFSFDLDDPDLLSSDLHVQSLINPNRPAAGDLDQDQDYQDNQEDQ